MVVFGLLVPVAIVSSIIVLILMIVISARKNTRKERLHVIKAIYFYAISFITLIMVIGGGVALFMAASDYVSPSNYISTIDEYKTTQIKYDPTGKEVKSTLTEAQWEAKYEQYKQNEKERAKQQALNSLIKSFGWIIIPAPIFLYTQRRIREIKSEA
jgi:cellobiose-specific phosphotransferase system component IIC